MALSEPLRPQSFPHLAPERVILPVRQGRNADDVPHVAIAAEDRTRLTGPALGQETACGVILVPARQHHHPRAAGLQTASGVVLIGIPHLVALRLGFGRLTSPKRVIDDQEITPVAGEAREDARGHVLAVVLQLPLVTCCLSAGKAHTEDVAETRAGCDL